MSLTIPPAKNYQSPLIATVSRLQRTPPDGPRQVSMEFDWLTMGTQSGAGATLQTAVYVNMANNATLRFSQVVSMKVDNSLCGCDVQFVFTDTQETVLVPAYEPNAIFPVFTDQTQFYAIALGNVLPNDVTRVQALNFVPPPVALPASTEQNIVTSTPAFISAAGNTQLIPATVSGTLLGLFLSVSVPNAPSVAGTQSNLLVVDGSGTNFLLNTLSLAVPNGVTIPYVTLYDRDSLNWRFKNGVVLNNSVTGWGTGNGILNISAIYRTP